MAKNSFIMATLIVIGQQGFSCGFVSSFLPACRSLGCDTRLSQSHRPPLLLSSARGRMNRRKVPVCSQASSQQQICIVGGGFGGLYTALNLAKYLDAKGKSKETSVTLISESERFVYSPFLYELVTGELQDWEVAPVYTDVLKGTGVRFLHGRAQGVDKLNKTIHVDLAPLAGGGTEEVTYDKLILAMGGNSKDENEQESNVFGFRSFADAKRLRAKLAGLKFANKKRIKIAVIGGGYPGVELSCSLAASMKSQACITIFQRGDKLLPRATSYNRIVATQRLQELGVKKLLRTEVVEIQDNTMSWKTNGGDIVKDEFDIIVRASSSRPAVLKGLEAQGEDGRIQVDHKLKVKDEEDLYAVGDIARAIDFNGIPSPTTAQGAMQQAEVVAWNVLADLTGGIPLTYKRQDLGEMLSLGGYTASLSSKALGLQLDDKLAHLMRSDLQIGVFRLLTNSVGSVYLIRMPSVDHKLKVASSWFRRLPNEIEKSLGLR